MAATPRGRVKTRSRSVQVLNPFHTLLEQISKEIEKDQLESLKFLLDEVIPDGPLYYCTTARRLFKCMMQRGLLGENNLDYFEQLLTNVDRSDLAEEVRIYKEQRRMEVDGELRAVEMVYFLFAVQKEHFKRQETMDALLNSMSRAYHVDPGQCRFVQCQEVAVNWFNLILELPKRKELLDGLRIDAITKAPWLFHCGVKAVRIGNEAEIHMQSPMTRSLSTSIRADVPCIQVPSAIKARGPRARLAFENALKTGKVKVYRARIMLIGQDRAGKTSFKKSLLGLPFDPEEQSTEGIDVDPSKFKVDVDQVKNWQRTNEKLDVSQFETDVVRMVAEELKKEQEEAQEKTQKTEKTQEGRGDPLMASHSKNGEPVTPELNIFPVLPSENFTDLLVQYLEGLNLQTDETTKEPHITLDLWDFAGQHVYYASYPAFLSTRALYMLVYNLSKGLKDTAQPCFRRGIHDTLLDNPNQETNLENLLSWLVSVSTMCSNPEMDGNKESRKDLPYCQPPVFIVGTHADKPHQDIKQMEKQIQKEICGKDYEVHVIRPFFSIDNTQGSSCEEVGKLQKRMIEVLKQEPYMGEEVPLRWFNFEKVVRALVAQKTYYLNLEQLQTIIQKVCFIEDEDEVVTMLDFYHDLGMIVKHRSTVILQAQWLIGVFKQLITIRSYNNTEPRYSKLWKEMETTGVLSVELVDHVFSKCCQKGLTREDILDMMEQFGLIVKFSTSPSCEMYFVPCQLRTPPEDLCKIEPSPSDPCPLYLHFLGGFVPHGLFSQLVSRCTRWCCKSGFKQPPNLFNGAARFFVEEELIHQLILVCKKRFIKIVLKQMMQEHKVPAKVEVPIMVQRFLEDTMENLSHELPWLKNLTYELCVECPYCLRKKENKCHNHGEVFCTHEDCMCLMKVPPDGLLSYCPKSFCDEILKFPQLEKWFSIKEEESSAKQLKRDLTCSSSHDDKQRKISERAPGHEALVNNYEEDAAIRQMTQVVVKEGSPSDDELEGLSRRIKDWKSLGRRLKFDDGMLHGFHKDNEEWSEKGYAMLTTWKEREGFAATYQVLFEALCHKYVNRTDLAEEICCSCKPQK